MFFILFPDVEKLATCQKSPQSQMFVLVVLCLYVCVHGKKEKKLVCFYICLSLMQMGWRSGTMGGSRGGTAVGLAPAEMWLTPEVPL